MKIAVLAASGKAGKLITQEALTRGFEVVAFVRDSAKMSHMQGLKLVEKDIFDLKNEDLNAFDVVINAFGVVDEPSLFEKSTKHLVSILKDKKIRYLVVGGAGSLYMDKDKKTRLIDTPDFPEIYKAVAYAHAQSLDFLRTINDVNWVYVSPPAEFVYEGAKTGQYKIIGEFFELNPKGESKGSYADYAAAMLDIASDLSINKQRVGVIGL